jgi:hypothetical protein
MDKAQFDASQFVLIRHALSHFNMAQFECIAKFGAKSDEMKNLDFNIADFDPELHPIGIAQA